MKHKRDPPIKVSKHKAESPKRFALVVCKIHQTCMLLIEAVADADFLMSQSQISGWWVDFSRRTSYVSNILSTVNVIQYTYIDLGC